MHKSGMDLVSIITPCYNGEDYIGRFLSSILKQTYEHIELIIINDGSTDKTEKVILSFKPLLEKKGIIFKYFYQENQGQSVAVNKGLKVFNGKYFTWPDCDDFYCNENAIRKMVDTLEKSSDDVSIVRCSAKLVNERNLSKINKFENKCEKEVNFFDIATLGGGETFWFQPICYMAKTSNFLLHIPDRDIYTNKDAGQNWQILLPLFYRQKCFLIEDVLISIVVREQSHSRGMYKTYDKVRIRIKAYEDTLYNTIERIGEMPNDEKIRYCGKIKAKYLKKNFDTAFKHGDANSVKRYYNEMVNAKKKNLTFKEKIKFRICKFSFAPKLIISIYWLLRK
jgi:glycosyltransferase involved in cell wall biosynthesis